MGISDGVSISMLNLIKQRRFILIAITKHHISYIESCEHNIKWIRERFRYNVPTENVWIWMNASVIALTRDEFKWDGIGFSLCTYNSCIQHIWYLYVRKALSFYFMNRRVLNCIIFTHTHVYRQCYVNGLGFGEFRYQITSMFSFVSLKDGDDISFMLKIW